MIILVANEAASIGNQYERAQNYLSNENVPTYDVQYVTAE